MHRVTLTIDDGLMADLDRFMRSRHYENRSEALRDLARAGLEQVREDGAAEGQDQVAALVYVYDHDVRELSKRLASGYHEHHAVSVATLHVHIDQQTCMEVAVLRGQSAQLRGLAARVIAQRGVRHGRLVLACAAASEPHGGHSPPSREKTADDQDGA